MRLLQTVEDDPAGPLSLERVALATSLGPDPLQVRDWWLDRVRGEIGDARERHWLALAGPTGAGRALTHDEVEALALASTEAVQAAVASGVSPAPGAKVERRMLAALLAGALSDIDAPGEGLVADLVNVLAPRNFLALAKRDVENLFVIAGGHCDTFVSGPARQDIFNRLAKHHVAFKKVQASMSTARTSHNTIAPWSTAADHLRAVYGPCWLAAETALIGASVPSVRRRDVGPMDPRGTSFGSGVDYGRMVNDTRRHRSSADWWQSEREAIHSPEDRAVWALALLGVADANVVRACIGALAQGRRRDGLRGLVPRWSRAPVDWASPRSAERLPAALVPDAIARSVTVGVLIARHADALTSTTSDLADAYDAETAMAASRLGVASWPVLRAVGTSLAATGEKRWLTALSVFGAQGIRTATGRSTLHRAPPSCATRPRSRRRGSRSPRCRTP